MGLWKTIVFNLPTASPTSTSAATTATRTRIQGPLMVGTTNEAERIKRLYPNRVSVSRPLPHAKRSGWWVVYVDVFPQTGTSIIAEAQS